MKVITRQNQIRERRKRRVRNRVHGTKDRPRLCVFRSLHATSVQIIDDIKGKTLVSASSREVKQKGTKTELAKATGKLLAERAEKAGVHAVVVDRGSYRYHGRVKALVDATRESGLSL